MPAFFISHSSKDNEAAERVRSGLAGDGFSEVFLDFHPEQGIPAGRQWEDEIYSQLHKADAVVFLCTASAVSSSWCHTELALARALRKLVLPLRLEAGVTHPLIRDTQ